MGWRGIGHYGVATAAHNTKILIITVAPSLEPRIITPPIVNIADVIKMSVGTVYGAIIFKIVVSPYR